MGKVCGKHEKIGKGRHALNLCKRRCKRRSFYPLLANGFYQSFRCSRLVENVAKQLLPYLYRSEDLGPNNVALVHLFGNLPTWIGQMGLGS
jgi:hypothetical protein